MILRTVRLRRKNQHSARAIPLSLALTRRNLGTVRTCLGNDEMRHFGKLGKRFLRHAVERQVGLGELTRQSEHQCTPDRITRDPWIALSKFAEAFRSVAIVAS